MRDRFRHRVGLIAGSALAALALVPASALAGGPGTWTRVTGTPVPAKSTDEVGLARTATGLLHVAYTTSPPGEPDTLLHKAISANARTVSGPDPIVQLEAISNQVELGRTMSGGLQVFFAGLTGAPGADGFMRTAVAGSTGKAWGAPVPASNAVAPGVSKVYAASGIGASPAADGTPVTIWGDSGPGEAGIHIGLDPAAPDMALFPGESRCCIVNPAVALERDAGQVYTAWVNLIGDPFIEVRQLGGATLVAPESRAAQLSTGLGLTGRSSGGMYLAYVTGKNQFLGSPALWRVGDGKAKIVPGQRGAQNVGVSTAPGGRLWLFWTRRGRVVATRTNRAATKFGAIVSPASPPKASTLYRVTGESSRGPLDALALFRRGGSDLGYWHQRLLPGLSLRVPPATVAAGEQATFRVSDAGDRVKGAKVELELGGATSEGTTSATGRVKLAVPAGTRPGRYRARATKGGYAMAKRTVRVR